jgi:formate hydrogenlyase subunit 3/multisubunit Na+/H+ antiporter MnhD subunit
MSIELVFILTIVILTTGMVGVAFLPEKHRAIWVIIIVMLNALLTSIPSVEAIAGHLQTGSFLLPHFPGTGLKIAIDKLSAWFILIINFTSINGILFGKGYLKSYKSLTTNLNLHWIFYMLFHISMVWVCMIDHGIAFLVAWELMSVSSLFLVIFEYQNKETLKAGLNYMVQMHLSVVFLTAGILWMYAESGSFSLSALSTMNTGGNGIWIIILLFVGFAIKAGFLPFHTWLPHAHPAAPSHVSGVMSGVIVKLGIYGIFRIIAGINQNWLIIGEILLSISVITALFGIVNAAVKYDFKRSLAFCTVENIGIIGMAMGMGLIGVGLQNASLTLLGFSGALLHVLNHSLFKSLLFFGAGSVYQQTHTRNIEKLGGLIKHMPVTAALFLIGALAIGGLPPFNGFVSEFLIYKGLISGMLSVKGISDIILLVLSTVGLVLVGGISVFAFTKMFGVIFLGNSRSAFHHKPVESSLIMLLPQILIVAVMLSIGLFPQFYIAVVTQIVTDFYPSQLLSTYKEVYPSFEMISSIGRVSVLFIVVIGVVFFLRNLVTKKRDITECETWGCGYVQPVAKAQYTGRSYARTFGALMGIIIKEKKNYHKIEQSQLYPEVRKFSTYYFDVVEKYVVMPLVKRFSHTLNYFQFIQNGKIQSYVIYGLFFILVIFLGSLLNFIR